jgi:hypothetical protein
MKHPWIQANVLRQEQVGAGSKTERFLATSLDGL